MNHDAFVATWMERVATGRSRPQLVELLDLAFNALCASARKTLGEVTLAAIVDRVLYNAAERHPFLADVTFEDSTIRCGKLLQQTDPPDETATKDGLRFAVTEFLTVLGNLTAQILTPTFYAELSKFEKLVPHAEQKTARSAGDAKDE